MSRLYGRTVDIYSISKYFNENYNNKYVKDKTNISVEELEDAPKVISPYLSFDSLKYLNDCNVEIGWNLFTRETIYSGYGEENNIIIFPTKKMKEEYKRELIYFLGDLLKRKSPDLVPGKFDIKCQYSDILPLLVEYLYMKDTGKEENYSDKHLSDLALNAKEYVKMYEGFNNGTLNIGENNFLFNSLIYLVPLSSLDATLQIVDLFKDDNEELMNLIDELVENKEHNREEIMAKRNIDTYGFKRLRKEIDWKRGK